MQSMVERALLVLRTRTTQPATPTAVRGVTLGQTLSNRQEERQTVLVVGVLPA